MVVSDIPENIMTRKTCMKIMSQVYQLMRTSYDEKGTVKLYIKESEGSLNLRSSFQRQRELEVFFVMHTDSSCKPFGGASCYR